MGTACYTMDIMRSKKTVVLLAFLIVFLSGMLAVAFFSAKTHDTLQYGANPTLSSQITKYMEAQVGPRTYGHENYHCANKLIAYDEIHAYAWLFCQGYTNYSLGVNGTGEVLVCRFDSPTANRDTVSLHMTSQVMVAVIPAT